MEAQPGPPLRPTQYAERILVTSILDGTYPAGTPLPGERSMADQLGVTRPTLRETLQRLAVEGWVKIKHGKPTVVNDYWLEGGLSMISTLAKYTNFLPNGFITQLLEVRAVLLPPVAELTAIRQPDKMLDFLSRKPLPEDEETTYAVYDWELQMLLTRGCGNPVYALIFNDFASIYKQMAAAYFREETSQKASLSYYRELEQAIAQADRSVEKVVKDAMQKSIEIWRAIRPFAANR
ncbi:MAG: GntR family transcriptional regulator [Desulfobacterales bacterium]|jgi:GntR family negative regulator for fad regulon and positive regulator of fabA|nr:GntR family transcriptional regulator [Deltaproteobacteria bacterium]